MQTLKGKVALVMGAAGAGNMGQVIARRLAAKGASVMVAGRQAEELARLAKAIDGDSHLCDITRQDQIDATLAATIDRFGALDIAVNATGVNQVKSFLDVTIDDLLRVTDVQLIGTFLFMQAVLRHMRDNGSIIQISSVSAYALLPDHAAYMATKAAGDVLVRALACEFGARGIRINAIAPGPTADTPMAAVALSDPTIRQRIVAAVPLGRLGTASDIAEAVLWLSGPQSFITGEVIQVNGGRAIPRLR